MKYTVTVEVGKLFEFDVEADSESEACEEAESRAMELCGETNIRKVRVKTLKAKHSPVST